MSNLHALIGADIFDGHERHNNHALLIDGRSISAIVPITELPKQTSQTCLNGGLLVPGFVDLQVNGGGGVLFNDNPGVDFIRQICDAHARLGTTSLLPTLITDTRQKMQQAIDAAVTAVQHNVPGIVGLHLEGPFFALSRKGAHDQTHIRQMDNQDVEMLVAAGGKLPCLMITLAPECVRPEQITTLADAGIHVSLGHSDCRFRQAMQAFDSGAKLVTHLFNAMSPLTHREPGLAGAALQSSHAYVGLIADGIHVDPAAMAIALRAKKGPGRLFLVSDAMPPTGSNIDHFDLNGRRIVRLNGRLTLEDGTLAGADIDMAGSVRTLVQQAGATLEEALCMACRYPAEAVGLGNRFGSLEAGRSADFVHLDNDLQLIQVWRKGKTLLGHND